MKCHALLEPYAKVPARSASTMDADSAISELAHSVHTVKEQELARLQHKLAHLGTEQWAGVICMANRLANRLVHQPAVALREEAGRGRPKLFEVVKRLFELTR